MTGQHSLGSLFSSASNWWDEKSFRLYYYLFLYDPTNTLHAMPVEQQTLNRITVGMNTFRSNFLNSTTTRIAAGDEAKPAYGDVWAGFLTHLQNGLRPAIDIALRTGFGAPARLALLAIAGICLCDYLYGGHMRDAVTHLIAGINSESGKINNPVAQETLTAPDFRPEIFRLYARPSVF